MKKCIIIFILLFIMLSGTTVFAFTDVASKDWYYKDITLLQQQGVISGYLDGTFKPHNAVSLGESLKMIMNVAEIPVGPAPQGIHCATNYYLKAVELDILPLYQEIDLNQPITREKTAEMVVKTLALDNQGLKVKLDNFEDTKDRNANILANAGILNGVKKEDSFYFKPYDLITRAEISAILVRVQNYKVNLLKQDQEGDELPRLGLYNTLSDEEIDFVKEPLTVRELEKVFVYMASSGNFEYTLDYKSIGFSQMDTDYAFSEIINKAFDNVYAYYPEYFTFINQFTYRMTGTSSYVSVTITFNPNFETTKTKEMLNVFFEEATGEVIDLIEEKKLTQEMAQKEKAKVLYDWIIKNTEYDRSFQDESFTGYGQVVNGKAVCQGYTATYNYMCKLVGIDVHGITGRAGENHMWTVATIDGEKVHIDSTWGDNSISGLEPDYSFFVQDSESMRKTHEWDSERFGI